MSDRPYRGVFPVVPTPFADDGALDLDGQRRVIDCMISSRGCVSSRSCFMFLTVSGYQARGAGLCTEGADDRTHGLSSTRSRATPRIKLVAGQGFVVNRRRKNVILTTSNGALGN